MCVCVRVRVHVRASVRASVHVRASVCVSVRMCASVYFVVDQSVFILRFPSHDPVVKLYLSSFNGAIIFGMYLDTCLAVDLA